MSDTTQVIDGTETTGALDTTKTEKLVREKIVHVLSIYPCISPTMLQLGIGTGLPPDLWHPVLDAMLKENSVSKTQVRAIAPSGRDQVYTRLQLVNKA